MDNLYQAILRFNRLQSENYDGAQHDLEEAQEEIRRELEGFRIERGLVRWWIECQPAVRKLRNKLDDGSAYESGDALAAAAKMRPDVLTLMDYRDEAARSLRYAGYVDTVLAVEGLTEELLRRHLTAFLELRLPEVAEKAKADGVAMGRWFSWLEERAKLAKTEDAAKLLGAFAKRLGMEDVLALLDVRMSDGVCFASQLEDGRIQMHIAEAGDVLSRNTLFHEFGHACVYAHLPKGRLPWLSQAVDEVLAVLFENAGVRLLGDAETKRRGMEMLRTEYTRTCVSGLFELDLWRDRSEPEALYRSWYERLGVGTEPALWARDSFRSIDCMTIYAYTVGQMLADSVSDEVLVRMLPELAKGAAEMTLGDVICAVERAK